MSMDRYISTVLISNMVENKALEFFVGYVHNRKLNINNYSKCQKANMTERKKAGALRPGGTV